MMSEQSILWGKLTPLTKGLNAYALRQSQIFMGRNTQCKVCVQKQNRLSGKHCVIKRRDNKVYLTDLSTNGTYKGNGQKIGKNNEIELNDGDQVWLLPTSKVSYNESIGFKFTSLLQKKAEPIKQIKQTPKLQQEQSNKFIKSLRQQITCPFCCQIMIFPVTVQPCNHRLCGPCLTHLVNKKVSQCINCRKELISAARDPSFNAIIEDYCRSNPSQKRNDQDDQPNIFGYNPTFIRPIIFGEQEQNRDKHLQKSNPNRQDNQMEVEQQNLDENKRSSKKQGKDKRPRRPPNKKKQRRFISSDISAETDSDVEKQLRRQSQAQLSCSQCLEQRNEFKCSQNQQHVKCHNCSKVFANRNDPKFKQSCTICNSFFCNLYLPPCQKNGPKLILLGKNPAGCKIEPMYFRNNKVEMNAFQNLLYAQKKTLHDMYKSMINYADIGRFKFMIDKRITRGIVQKERHINLNSKSAVCDNCWRQLWFQMIFFYIKDNEDYLPQSIRSRASCYWGINCKSMDHNIEHAKKFNHMEYQSRF